MDSLPSLDSKRSGQISSLKIGLGKEVGKVQTPMNNRGTVNLFS
jgi:hypothetical protein